MASLEIAAQLRAISTPQRALYNKAPSWCRMNAGNFPGSRENGQPPPDRLEGWKQIAGYLRCDPKTAQRWEKSLGLPIYRHPGGGVWAAPQELAVWLAGGGGDTDPTPAGPSRQALWPRIAGISIAVLVGVLALTAAVSWSRRAIKPSAFPPLPDRLFARALAEGGAIRELRLTGSSDPRPAALVLSPDGRYLYVTDSADYRSVRVVDPDRMAVVSTISVPGEAARVVASPDGKTLYFATLSDGLQITDRETGRSRSVHTGMTGPLHDIAMTPDGEWLYISLARRGLRKFRVSTGEVIPVPSVTCPKFLNVDPTGRFLAVSTQCGDPATGRPGRDSVEVFDRATELRLMRFQGPPLLGGPVTWIPNSDRIYVDGWDACRTTPAYEDNRKDCAYFPGHVAYVWQTSDRTLVRRVATPDPDIFGSSVFAPEGTVAVLGGRLAARVVDTTFFRTRESLSFPGTWLLSPVIDEARRRIYLAGPEASTILALDLPVADCNSALAGLEHHWPLDGTLDDPVNDRRLSSGGSAEFVPGLIGQAAGMAKGPLEFTTPNMTADGVTALDGTLSLWFRANGPGTLAEFLADSTPVWRLSLSPDGTIAFGSNLARYGVGPGPSPEAGPLPEIPQLQSSAKWADDGWHHLAVARQGDKVRLLVDARRQAEVSMPAPRQFGPARRTLRFGPFPGKLDEPALYNHAVAGTELAELVKHARSCLTGAPSALSSK